MSIRHAKQRGEWAELRFMTRATELGFRVSKPWGDSAPYDLAIDHRGRFRRVQVKCTIFHRGNPTNATSTQTASPTRRMTSTSSPHVIPSSFGPPRIAAKRRKNSAHGASRGDRPVQPNKPRRGEGN